MPLIPYPNVPNSPGVPAIPRIAGAQAVPLALAALQGILWTVLETSSQWGVWDSQGNPVADPSVFRGITGAALEALGIGPTYSVNTVDYRREGRVSDFPVEQGSFATYNKVQLPANPIVTLALDASTNDRSFFLSTLDAATTSTETFSVVTPEITYVGYTIDRMSYKRTAPRGANLLIVELSLQEVREVSAAYSTQQINSPQDAGATPPESGGRVQAATPDTSTLQSLYNAFPSSAGFQSAVTSFMNGGGN